MSSNDDSSARVGQLLGHGRQRSGTTLPLSHRDDVGQPNEHSLSLVVMETKKVSNKLDLALEAREKRSLPTKPTTRIAPSGRAALVLR
jgi:hypothetical protein